MINFLIALVLVGGLIYLIRVVTFLDPMLKNIAYVVVVVVFIIYVLRHLGDLGISL